jgi:hypothetical protein
MADPTAICDAWLYTELTGDATLMALITGVYADIAPEGTALPYVVFSLQTARDRMTIEGNTILTGGTYIVKAITDEPSYATVATIMARVHTLLHQANGTGAGGTVIECVRESVFHYVERVAETNKLYRHLGGLYTLLVQ